MDQPTDLATELGHGRYMEYDDNPKRPKLHFWFGPMTMVDFLGNYFGCQILVESRQGVI